MKSLRTAHEFCSPVVWLPTLEEDQDDQERRVFAVGRDKNSGDRDRSGWGGRDRRGCGGGSGGGDGGGHEHGVSSGHQGGGHSGGGSGRNGDNYRRNGGGEGRYGGGRYGRQGGSSGKGSRGKGRQNHSSSRAHNQRASGRISSISSEDSDRTPDVTVVRGKRQLVPCLVEVSSSAEFLGCVTNANDRAKPVFSDVAHARSTRIEAATAAAVEKHVSLVQLRYSTTPL